MVTCFTQIFYSNYFYFLSIWFPPSCWWHPRTTEARTSRKEV